MKTAGFIALFGALGAVCRYGVNQLLPQASAYSWPWATFLCNIAGSFMLGAFFAYVSRYFIHDLWREALGTGFIGAFTTFSSFSLETVHMLEHGQLLSAAGYIVSSAGIGLAAVYAGCSMVKPHHKQEEGQLP